MAHEAYIREIPGSRQAVVMIHGILGSPEHFRELLPLIPADRSVYNILLDGHGKGVEEFSRTSMAKWKAQVSALLDDVFSRYEEVILVTHSMGTLFSIQEAAARPDKIRSLFLLQVPLRPRLTFRCACHGVLMPFGIVPEAAADMRRDTSITLTRKLWKYLGWVPRFLELFRECAATRQLLGQVRCPCHCFQSRRDELVSMKSCGDLARHPQLQVTVLPDSGHFAYYGQDLELLKRHFSKLFTA